MEINVTNTIRVQLVALLLLVMYGAFSGHFQLEFTSLLSFAVWFSFFSFLDL